MTGETIICLAPRCWDSLWRESQQLMSRIAKQNRVFYLEPGLDTHGGQLAEMVRNFPNLFTLRPRVLHENLIVIPTPPNLPIARRYLPPAVLEKTVPIITDISNRMVLRHIRWTMQRFQVQDPILWLFSPFDVGLLDTIGEKLSCYFNYDEFSEFAHNARVKGLLQQYDRLLCRQVDVVFATSRAQWEGRKATNPESYFVPNGVDFELFSQALDQALALPEDLVNIPQPIIGFAGWLGYHIDTALLCKVAETYSDCSLVLVGPDDLPASADRRRLSELDNVFFLGKKKLQELPAYLKAFDVALMPWSLSGHIRWAYPLKLHEYLAAGRAAVATALPELQPFSHVLRIAETHAEFLSHIQTARTDYAPPAVAQRVNIARENTWDARVEEIYRVLDAHLQRAAQAIAA